MSDINAIFINKNLADLFTKEGEILERILPFCRQTKKEVESQYSLFPNGDWKLEIKVIDNERKK